MLRQMGMIMLAGSVFLADASAIAQSGGAAKGLQSPTSERGVIIISGKVVRIEGASVTVRDAAGNETVISGQTQSAFKVGDAVAVKNGRLEKSR